VALEPAHVDKGAFNLKDHCANHDRQLYPPGVSAGSWQDV